VGIIFGIWANRSKATAYLNCRQQTKLIDMPRLDKETRERIKKLDYKINTYPKLLHDNSGHLDAVYKMPKAI
jgi:hypothetical protein